MKVIEVFIRNIRQYFDYFDANLLGLTATPKNDIDKKIIDTYSSKYMDKVYYTIDGNTLIIDGEKPHSNKIGLGFNYLTGYGTTFNIGSDLVF